MANNQTTYAGSTPCPCDDCDHIYYCYNNSKQCKVFSYWTKYGKVLKRKFNTGKTVVIERVPDMEAV